MMHSTAPVVINFGLRFLETVWNIEAVVGCVVSLIGLFVLVDVAVSKHRRRRGEPEE